MGGRLPPGLPAEILRSRPDVAEAEQNLVAANAQIGAAQALFYPQITLTGTAGFESLHVQHALDWENRIWSIGANVRGPVYLNTSGTVQGAPNALQRGSGSVERAALAAIAAAVAPETSQPAAALPTQTFFYGPQKHSFGGQDIEYAIMPQAHTDGDIYVFFPRENVLVATEISQQPEPWLNICQERP